jgi:hypothetical protein
MTKSAHDLIRFLHLLRELNSDWYGLSSKVQQDRIERWMDAVLPPPPTPSEGDSPEELTKAAKPESEMLPLPYTFPDTGFAYQLLSVVEDHNDDCKMHVELADSMDYAESWGAYLADVARVIARDYAGYLDTTRDDGDLFAAMCSGFAERASMTEVEVEKLLRHMQQADKAVAK